MLSFEDYLTNGIIDELNEFRGRDASYRALLEEIPEAFTNFIYEVPKYFTKFESNKYSQNLGSGKSASLSISGLFSPLIVGEEFYNNGDAENAYISTNYRSFHTNWNIEGLEYASLEGIQVIISVTL